MEWWSEFGKLSCHPFPYPPIHPNTPSPQHPVTPTPQHPNTPSPRQHLLPIRCDQHIVLNADAAHVGKVGETAPVHQF
ncbi:MAG: hypothetical protein OHK0037_11300 [Elainellaceae cyanobacterium]